MKVLLVVPRYSHSRSPDPSYLFPLGLGYISSSLKKAGHQVTCLNLNHHHGGTARLVHSALEGGWCEAVCTGHMGAGIEAVRKVVEAARRHPSRPLVILGGLLVTSAPETVIGFLRPDFAVLGEGEESVVELLGALERGKDPSTVRGIGWPGKDGKAVLTPPRDPPADLDALPWPDFEGLGLSAQLDLSPCNVQSEYIFSDHPRFYPLLGSRGCPFRCTFCYHPGRYRARSIPAILAELRANIPRYDINGLFLYDDVLAASPRRLAEFCSGMTSLQQELGRSIAWLCQLSVQNLDRGMMGALKEAGCFSVTFGFESMSPAVLSSMGKPITPEQIDRAFRLSMEEGMALHANFIFGDPAETAETARQTLDYWAANCRGQVVLGFVQPYPGSALYRRCRQEGLIGDELSFIRNRMGIGHTGVYINMTEGMTDRQFRRLRREVAHLQERHNRFVRPLSVRRESPGRYRVAIRCPWCGRVEVYRNFALPNRPLFTFWMNCRACNLRFNLVSAAALVVKRFFPLRLRFAAEWIYNLVLLARKRAI